MLVVEFGRNIGGVLVVIVRVDGRSFARFEDFGVPVSLVFYPSKMTDFLPLCVGEKYVREITWEIIMTIIQGRLAC